MNTGHRTIVALLTVIAVLLATSLQVDALATGHSTELAGYEKAGVGNIAGWLFLGFLTLGVVISGFSSDGMPVTRRKRIKGTPAKLLACFCILVFLVLVWMRWDWFEIPPT